MLHFKWVGFENVFRSGPIRAGIEKSSARSPLVAWENVVWPDKQHKSYLKEKLSNLKKIKIADISYL